MIKRLQKLKSARGFTMIELIVVIAILAVLVAAILVGSNNTNKRIEEANSTATDFYSALQTEFTNLQMFDGPITMTLAKVYSNSTPFTIGSLNTSNYGGIKYYPFVGGNYPFDNTVGANCPSSPDAHLADKPKDADLYLCFYVDNDQLQNVTWANTTTALLALNAESTADASSELEAVLENEMAERMSYKDGYYYAYIRYDAPDTVPGGLTSVDYKDVPVKVLWTAFCNNKLDASAKFKSQGILENGRICGVCKTQGYEPINRIGSELFNFTPTP